MTKTREVEVKIYISKTSSLVSKRRNVHDRIFEPSRELGPFIKCNGWKMPLINRDELANEAMQRGFILLWSEAYREKA